MLEPPSDEHIGKLVRSVEDFYTGSGRTETRWIVCAVVSGVGQSSKMTGEILELTMDQVETVNESKADKAWANLALMGFIRMQVGQGKKRRKPGAITYGNLTAFIQSQNTPGSVLAYKSP